MCFKKVFLINVVSLEHLQEEARMRFYLLQLLLWPAPFNFLEVVQEILQHVKGQNAAKIFHLLLIFNCSSEILNTNVQFEPPMLLRAQTNPSE